MNLRRILKISGIVIAAATVIVVGAVLTFFYLMAGFEDYEIGRYPNPSGTMEAVLVERSGNATVSIVTLIYLVPPKTKLPEEPHFSADLVDGLKIQWNDDENIDVLANQARINEIRYYFENPPAIKHGNIRYKIQLIGR